ncbi:hypothetical protein JCM10207_009134 [Rhodosporidiobolus poonsookiae]
MILGIGVDLLHLPRLRAILAKRDPLRLATRICSAWELEQWNQLRGDTPEEERFLALRWTAKEAAYKALYPALRPVWKDLEIRKVDKKPFLDFSPEGRRLVSEADAPSSIKMHLSVSHDADMMVAYVVAEKTP